MSSKSKNKGFTLIELLVVISIISLLSSIVLVTLGNVKGKAKDAVVKSEVNQLEKLMMLNYDTYGSYCQLSNQQYPEPEGSSQGVWVSVTESNIDSCLNRFYGIYANEAIKICEGILNNSNKTYTNRLYLGTDYNFTPSYGCSSNYSIGAYLNSGKFYCSGSSGRRGEYSGSPEANFLSIGCYRNP